MKNPFSLEGKIALVTGASYGIGFAIASGFAEAGAKIVFNDINQELVAGTSTEIVNSSTSGYTAAWKKAIVTLTEDSDTIDFFDGLL